MGRLSPYPPLPSKAKFPTVNGAYILFKVIEVVDSIHPTLEELCL